MRVVYALEVRQVEASQQAGYRGFKMFDIFAEDYLEELREFLTVINADMVAMLDVWCYQHNQSAQQQAQVLLSLKRKIDESASVPAARAVASLGAQIDEGFSFLYE